MDATTTTNKPSIQNPNSTMAIHFIKALTNIHQRATTCPSSFTSRSRRISRAAYASMAVAAGPRRAWSRALIQQLRSRRRPIRHHHKRVRVIVTQRRRRMTASSVSSSRVESLRRMVPGGESMEPCCLLEETASYVQCLRDQVTLMQSIVDSAADYC